MFSAVGNNDLYASGNVSEVLYVAIPIGSRVVFKEYSTTVRFFVLQIIIPIAGLRFR